MRNAYVIRQARIDDSFEIAKVHVDCWRTTYKDIVPDEKLENMSYENSREKWESFFKETSDMSNGILLAEYNKKVIGFCAGGRIRKRSKRTEGYEGEIKAVYILEEHQKNGVGKKIIAAYEEMFRKSSIFSYIIWVLKDNPSKIFYRKLGGKLITTKTYDIGGKKLKGLCFGFKISCGEC
jgi:GNAT superfamily N-acetyltransferase